ncbi:MAG: hypothetical protein AB1782_13300 [Cyanobacteriota bacterium]
MRKKYGSSLSQYVIIVIIIGLAVAMAYGLLGVNIKQNLANMVQSQEGINEQINENIIGLTNITPGSLGGNIDAPATKCNSGSCVIDYGNFVLNGVPENIQELVETTGASGGTENMASMIEQIADYLEASGQSGEATQLRDLANIGHFLAQIALTGESGASGCATNADPVSCFKAFATDPANSPTLPDNLKTILTKYEAVQVPGKAYQTLIGLHGQYGTVGTRIDTARMMEVTNPSNFDIIKAFNPAYQFVDIYDNVVANPNISQEVKDITKELYKNIAGITIEHQQNMSATYGQYTNMSGFGYDIYTGASVNTGNYGLVPLEKIVHPQTSLNTNIQSSLMCATGKFDALGKACK